MIRSKKKLGVALLGLGSYSTTQIAPALTQCKNCTLAGVITGTPIKASMWMRKHNIKRENVYSYDNFDEITHNLDIDVIYISVPNSLHLDFVLRAAKSGKHVICEKPLALTPDECEQMIKTCKEHSVKLSVGYRLLYSPYFEHLKTLLREDKNAFKGISGALAFNLEDSSNWRMEKDMSGGGALIDIGIYGIYTACFILDEYPYNVKAKVQDSAGLASNQVEKSISFSLMFPSQTVQFDTSYEDNQNFLKVMTNIGELELKNAFSLYGQRLEPAGGISFTSVNQVALHLDDFSRSIMDDEPTRIPGEYGLRDALIMKAIYRSIQTGRSVRVNYD